MSLHEALVSVDPSLIPIIAQTQPFNSDRRIFHVSCGATLAELLAIVIPEQDLRSSYSVFLNGERISPEWLPYVRPKPRAIVRIAFTPLGGQGAARIGAMVGLIVVLAVLTYFTAGTIWFVAVPVLGAAGMFAIHQFLPPPVPDLSKDISKDSPTHSISGSRNRMDPWGVVPHLLGRFRVVPRKAAEFRETEGNKNFYRIIFVWGPGPMTVSDLKIGETPLNNFRGVQMEFRRGYQDDQIIPMGTWGASLGYYPSSPAFGQTWTMFDNGTIDAVNYFAGDTITFNGLASATLSTAWDKNAHKPFTLFPSDVFDDPLALRLTSAGTPRVATTQQNAREIAVVLTFPSGLYHSQNVPPGKLADKTITVRIDYRPVGTEAWTTAVNREVSGRQRTAKLWSYRWTPNESIFASAPNGQFDVRVFPTGGHDASRNIADCYWTSLRTVTIADPMPIYGLAATAIRIQATSQLSGNLDEFSGVCHSICKYWDKASQQWKIGTTSNPAALDRSILQHSHLVPSLRLSDTEYDLSRIQEWSELCDDNDLQFNDYIDYDTTVGQTREIIARMGWAGPSLRDMRRSVVIEKTQTAPLQMFTPRDTWGFERDLIFPDPPHAFRVGFLNEEKDWQPDEHVVYADGYSEINASNFERIEPKGLTRITQAEKFGRRELARRIIQRESIRFNTHFQYLSLERGDLIAWQHDGMAVGLGSGRIKSRTEVGGAVTDVTTDERFVLEAGVDYVIRARRIVNDAIRTDLYQLLRVDTSAETNQLFFSETVATADAPAIGDLVAFGTMGRETIHRIIKDIEPLENLQARITCVPQLDYTGGPLPVFDPGVTRPRGLAAPQVLSVVSDESVMIVGANRQPVIRVVFYLLPLAIDATIHIHLRLSGDIDAQWMLASIESRANDFVAITGVEDGEVYDFRLQYTHSDYFSSPQTDITAHFVSGELAAPSTMTGLTIAAINNSALLRWDAAGEIDVLFGGFIQFRHSPLLTGAEWTASTSIGRTARGDEEWVFLPLKPGTYFAKIYDRGGRSSDAVAFVTTEQMDVLEYSPVGEVIEHPDFSGTKVNMVVASGTLHLAGTGSIDGEPNFDAIPNVDQVGAIVRVSGSYDFAAVMDLTTVKHVRVVAHLLAQIYSAFDFIDSRTEPIDSWADIDGSAGAPADAAVWMRWTNDNPTGTPTWSTWQRLDSQVVEARGFSFQLRAWTEDQQYNIDVVELRVTASTAGIAT